MAPPSRSPAAPVRGLLVLGNQLFPPKQVQALDVSVAFLREDRELCTYFRFHQQKIAFFLASMRAYAKELGDSGIDVTYEALGEGEHPYEQRLIAWCKRHGVGTLVAWEVEDRWFEARLQAACRRAHVALEVQQSPMFLTSRAEAETLLGGRKRPFMKTFYEQQRRRLRLLLQPNGEPQGGQWSFDADNRKPLPEHVPLPGVPKVRPSAEGRAAIELVQTYFAEHPGEAAALWLPTDRAGAKRWLTAFLEHRLASFGPYEDALSRRDDWLFHSALSPLLNVGWLLPGEVVRAAVAAAEQHGVPLASLEGFVRQVVGWREFVRGIYRQFDERQQHSNHFGHHRQLTAAWYRGGTGIPPLDDVIDKVVRRGWAHHIERLMVLGNLMLLLEVAPQQAYGWFMEMFVDSSDWVMGPNVFGMALFSDGGIFATKPYLCGSNYLRKMGGYKKGPWCDEVDGLYWRFVLRHQRAFAHNPRLSMMVRSAQRLAEPRKQTIFAAAERALTRLTKARTGDTR